MVGNTPQLRADLRLPFADSYPRLFVPNCGHINTRGSFLQISRAGEGKVRRPGTGICQPLHLGYTTIGYPLTVGLGTFFIISVYNLPNDSDSDGILLALRSHPGKLIAIILVGILLYIGDRLVVYLCSIYPFNCARTYPCRNVSMR